MQLVVFQVLTCFATLHLRAGQHNHHGHKHKDEPTQEENYDNLQSAIDDFYVTLKQSQAESASAIEEISAKANETHDDLDKSQQKSEETLEDLEHVDPAKGNESLSEVAEDLEKQHKATEEAQEDMEDVSRVAETKLQVINDLVPKMKAKYDEVANITEMLVRQNEELKSNVSNAEQVMRVVGEELSSMQVQQKETIDMLQAGLQYTPAQPEEPETPTSLASVVLSACALVTMSW